MNCSQFLIKCSKFINNFVTSKGIFEISPLNVRSWKAGFSLTVAQLADDFRLNIFILSSDINIKSNN